jgi:DnaJ-class molecular chaperone
MSSRPSIVATHSRAPSARKPGPLPETGAVEQVTDAQALGLASIARDLDALDYFQVLQVPQTALSADIKRAFYRESRVYHPDRFFHLEAEVPKEHIGRIYRRITEAYYVLRDDAKRRKYLADLASPERTSKLRYTEASEAELKSEAKKAQEDEFGTNPKARPFFKSALNDMVNQNWAAAERNLKLGLTYEPGNQKFKERLGEVQKKLDEHRRTSGDSFKIR